MSVAERRHPRTTARVGMRRRTRILGSGRRAVRAVGRLSAAERWTSVRAVVLLIYVEATIRWMALPSLTKRMGVRFETSAGGSAVGGPASAAAAAAAPRPPLPVAVEQTRRCVDRITRVWPFGSGPCLRESLVLGALLRSYQPMLRLGVARHGEQIRAHAWIEIDGGLPVNDPLGFRAFGSEGGR